MFTLTWVICTVRNKGHEEGFKLLLWYFAVVWRNYCCRHCPRKVLRLRGQMPRGGFTQFYIVYRQFTGGNWNAFLLQWRPVQWRLTLLFLLRYLCYGAFTICAGLHATKIRMIGKIYHVSQKTHTNHRAIKGSARTKCLKQYRTPVTYNLACHVTSMWYVLRVILWMENTLEIV